MSRKFEIVAHDEWARAKGVKRCGPMFVRTSKHQDVHEMLEYLKAQPGAHLSTQPQPSKAELQQKVHVMHEYARRRGLKINTFCGDDMRLYVRFAIPKIPKQLMPRKTWQVTTAAEWRELQKKAIHAARMLSNSTERRMANRN